MNFLEEMDFYTKSTTNNNGFINDMDTKFFSSYGIICAFMDLIIDKMRNNSYPEVDLNGLNNVIDSYKNGGYQMIERIILGGRILLQAHLIQDTDFDRIMGLISKNIKIDEIDDVVSIIKSIAFPEIKMSNIK